MPTTISTKTGKFFEQYEGDSILSSAEKSGINFQYSCRTGRCSSCRCKLISGKTKTFSSEVGLSEKEKSDGYILSCVRYAIDDILIEIDDLGDIELPKATTIPCKISNIEKVSEDIINLTLRIPPNTNFNFIPGQYLDIIGLNGVKRSYSIANNFQNNLIELHIKEVPNGEFSDYWFKNAKLGDLLRLNGPHGTFFLRESKKGIVLLATGTGIAPIKAILDSLEVSPDIVQLPIFLLWGVRKSNDLYIDFLDKYKNVNFKYIPVLSRPESSWHGRSGYVQDIVIDEKIDLSKYNVYACGSEQMISDAKILFRRNGLNESSFFSDAFVASSDIIKNHI